MLEKGANKVGRDSNAAPAAIQTWPRSDAPKKLAALLDESQSYDWVALVPAELNEPDVLALLFRNEKNSAAETQKLPDGSLLLGGYFAGENRMPIGYLSQNPAKVRRARTGGR